MEPQYLIGGPPPKRKPAVTPKDLADRAGKEHVRQVVAAITAAHRTETAVAQAFQEALLPKRTPGAALATEPAPEPVAPQQETGLYKGRDAAYWTQKALQAKNDRRFVDQWTFEAYAKLAPTNGIQQFQALFTLTGELVEDAKFIRTWKSIPAWRVGDEQTGLWFNPSQARNGQRRWDADWNKGFIVGLIESRGRVEQRVIKASVRVFIARDPHADFVIIDNGSKRSQYTDRP